MIRFHLFDRNGTTLLGVLAEPTSWQLSLEFSDVGALQFEYPLNGVNASQIAELREIAVVDTSNATELKNARYVITGIDRERAETDGVIRISCRSLLWRFETALAYPDGGVGSGSKRAFTSANGGTVLKTLIDAAQTRGALSGISYSFTNTTDSNSASWSGTVSQEFAARTTLLSIIRNLNDLGLAEVEMTGRQLRACNTDGIGTDRTTGASPIVLRYGQNLTEAPERLSAERLAGVALVEGDDDLTVERTNAGSVSTYGRLEISLTASGATTSAQVQALGDAYLANLASPDRQLTVGLVVADGLPRPLIDFNVGDYVYTATAAGLERVRVRQLTLSMDDGALTATAVLGDRIFESEIRFARRLAALTSSAANAGELPTPAPDPAPTDTIAPAAPTSLTGTTTAYVQAGEPRSQVDLTWTAPTTNSDGSALTDLRAYRVEMRTAVGEPWQFIALVDGPSATIRNLLPQVSYRFQVEAIDSSSNASAPSNEFTITTTGNVSNSTIPSTPTVSSRLGTISITWNGLSNTGGAMPADFSYVAVHASTTSGFTPSSANLVGRMNGADTIVLSNLVYNTTYFVRLVAYNKSGTASSPSTQASASIQPLVDTDIINNTISGAKIASGTITASDKIIGNTITGALIQGLTITGDKIAGNSITADKIVAGEVTAEKLSVTALDGKTITGSTVRTSAGASRVEMNSSGLFVFNAGTPVVSLNASGTASFTGTINSTSGSIGGFALSSGIIGDGSGTYISTSGQAAFNSTLTLRGTGTAISMQNGGNITMNGGTITMNGGVINTGGGNVNLGSTGSITNGSQVTVTGQVSMGSLSCSGASTFSGPATFNSTMFAPNLGTSTSATNLRVATGTVGEIQETSASSERFKENIVDLGTVYDIDAKKLLELPVRAFTYKADYLSENDDRFGAMLPGFIAEEVDAIYPVAADYAEGQPHSWNERFIIPGLLALIQDLNARIETLEGNA